MNNVKSKNIPKVNILLSTYNGEKYIDEQIKSLINQEYENIEIFVRDDGSKDNTINILKSYEAKGIITLDVAENKGPTGSFFELMNNSGDADYFAYCDQDDVWESWKIKKAVEDLEKKDSSIPLLWYSIYDFYDENMNIIKKGEQNNPKNYFTLSLLETYVAGCVEVFNLKACKMMREKKPYPYAFDGWLIRLAASLGEITYCGKPSIKHRIHGKNTSEAGAGFFNRWTKRFNRMFKDEGKNTGIINKRKDLAVFWDYYHDKLNENDKKVLSLFRTENKSFITQLKKLFYKGRFRTKLIDEIACRFLFTINKI